MNEPDDHTPTFFATVRWPLVVFGLLLGHTTLMLVAMTLANAGPSQVIDRETGAMPTAYAPAARNPDAPDQAERARRHD